MNQKFHRGDLVRVTVDLKRTPSRKHFPTNLEAYILGSYADLCHGRDDRAKSEFALHIVPSGHVRRGHSSWYQEHEFELVCKRNLRTIERLERLVRGEVE